LLQSLVELFDFVKKQQHIKVLFGAAEEEEDARLAALRVRYADSLARASVSLPRERTPELPHRLGYSSPPFCRITTLL
jgi:hypothetical protein